MEKEFKSEFVGIKLEPSLKAELKRAAEEKGWGTHLSKFIRIVLRTFYKQAPQNVD